MRFPYPTGFIGFLRIKNRTASIATICKLPQAGRTGMPVSASECIGPNLCQISLDFWICSNSKSPKPLWESGTMLFGWGDHLSAGTRLWQKAWRQLCHRPVQTLDRYTWDIAVYLKLKEKLYKLYRMEGPLKSLQNGSEIVWIWLSMHEYVWIWLNIIE